ncbi:hypothetical protein BDDG_13130 [Blastomyces dermatitidis ATCC 18188]|uniref:Uncharacterized protein n=1 Tax=Ajellomyces dermatitidis (strain ATCC 18188 / CBS 674.68) TaxID=653446 RepID=A0A0J9ERI2_AJEDA|nr:hypothetical protein BDDG_13130 [Blastomyces dermatitidis ATCC 18188]
MRGAENELNADTLVSRRNNISLQGTVTITAAAEEAEEDVAMKAELLWLIDTVFTFNLAFFAAMEAAAAS